jgi:hypothetical protein
LLGSRSILVCLILGFCGHFAAAINVSSSFNYYFLSFMIFEISVGIYFPSIGMLKASLVPDSMRSSVYALLNLPSNVIVLIVSLLNISPQIVFHVSSSMMAIALAAYTVLSTKREKLKSRD